MVAITYRMGAVLPVSDAKTTFLVFSDIHAFPFENAKAAFGIPCPKVDVVLHCGDLTQAGGIGEYKRTLNMLSAFDAELKLVIAGNQHVSLDSDWCQGPEDEEDYKKALKLVTGPAAVDAGVIYLTEGAHKSTLSNGVTFSIYASPYTPKFGDYAFIYDFREDRFNTTEQIAHGKTSIAKQPIPDGIDIVMTHGPPYMHHDKCRTGNAGCDMLMRALERTKPGMHCFGHIHEGAGTSTLNWRDGKETLLVNAAIMGGESDPTDKPTNMPIIVELVFRRESNA